MAIPINNNGSQYRLLTGLRKWSLGVLAMAGIFALAWMGLATLDNNGGAQAITTAMWALATIAVGGGVVNAASKFAPQPEVNAQQLQNLLAGLPPNPGHDDLSAGEEAK